MVRQSKPLQDMSLKSQQYYLIVDYQKKIFCLATKEQFEMMRDEYTSIHRSTLRTNRPSSAIFGFLSPQRDVDSSFWTTYLGWRQGLMMKMRSEEHTSELQSRENLVCRLLL